MARCVGWFVLAFHAVDRSATSKTVREVGMSRKDRRHLDVLPTPDIALHAFAGKPWPGISSVNGDRRRFFEFSNI
jgi:hypothetical protein